jgi:glycosyltransferase involved in cell wall biosynthesis
MPSSFASTGSAESDPSTVPVPTPRALLFFLAPEGNYRKPLFSPQEIFCGPDAETCRTSDRVEALRVPAGSFDIADVLRELPSAQQPELVIVKADATGRNFPRNLAALSCPKVLLVGDTHHMQRPIRTVLRYAQQEPFDFVIFDHTRHHAHLFAAAGVKNLHWLPAVDYGYVPRELKSKPTHPLTFVGQAGRHHPYRCWVLEQVKAAGLPLEILAAPLAQTADLYADSQVTLNISLNGDLNLRVFEALAAGGFLLTDELPEASGLPLLFQSGKHLETWRTPGELIEKIRYYLAHPAEAQRIRAAGQAELIRAHHPQVKLREFYDLIYSGKVNPRYELAQDRRFARAVQKPDHSLGTIEVHETLQELHRGAQQVLIYTDRPESCTDWLELPHLKVCPLTELKPTAPTPTELPEFSILAWHNPDSASLACSLANFTGRHVIAPTADETLQQCLDAWGFARTNETSSLYTLRMPGRWIRQTWAAGGQNVVAPLLASRLSTAADADECQAIAECAEALGQIDLQLQALNKAVALDRNSYAALVALAAITFERNDPVSTCVFLEETARIAPLPAEVDALRQNLFTQISAQENLAPYFRVIGRQPAPQTNQPRKILVVTNLFPPQELGGYGRMMWEFTHGLIARGHTVRVLAADVPDVAKAPTADEQEMETHVMRTLRLVGTWTNGRPALLQDQHEIASRLRDNAARLQTTVRKFGPDLVLMGNIDFLGANLINEALGAGLPVLHALANAQPGYLPNELPLSLRYWVAPCSNWNGAALRAAGFYPPRVETVYPGARVDRFFRFFAVDNSRLRICYASLVLPYKGVHVLLQALVQLERAGIDFTAEIAGDCPDPAFGEKLRQVVQQHEMGAKVHFTGFLDRTGLSALFARNNVLVFPSQFPEPFGISQVEAMAAGLVVVSSGTGGAREIVRNEVDGLLFKADNANELAEKLYLLARDPERMARLQQSAQTRAVEFSVEKSVLRIEQLMEEMLTTADPFASLSLESQPGVSGASQPSAI